MTSALGRAQDGPNLPTFRKTLCSFSLVSLLLISSMLLCHIIFQGTTLI